jgi:hypothetical protein
MIDGYSLFLLKFKEIYPETYIKIMDFPDSVVIGWINEIHNNKRMITLVDHQKVNDFFKVKITMNNWRI